MLESLKAQATSLSSLFPRDRCPNGLLLWLTMPCSQEGGWRRSRARREHARRHGGTVPYVFPRGVLHLPTLGRRSHVSIMAHIGGGPLPSCQEIHPPSSWDVDLVCFWTPAAVRYVLHQGLGPCRAPGAAWWDALLQPSSFFHVGIHVHLGCMHYLRSSLALIQLLGCLWWVFEYLLGKEASTCTCLAEWGGAGKFKCLLPIN